MKIVCSSRGSRGDVHPVMEIAAALRRAGHRVSICVPGMFADACRALDLDVSTYSEDSGRVMEGLASGMKAWRNALEWVSQSIDEQSAYMLRETADADAMVTSVNEFIAPTIAVYRGLPHYRIAYTPVLPGHHPPPLVPWQWLPGPVNRALWGAVNLSAALFMRGAINETRRGLGMDPVSDTARYFISDSHTILAINPVLAPPCRTWHGRYRFSYTGCCHGFDGGPPDSDLARFLDAGPPPVYLGFGSVSLADPAGFTAMALEAVRMAGCRAVLGAGWTGLGADDLPDTVFVAGDTNHAALFARCAGVAHHGGSGTTHTAARAGAPQFVMPQIADQYYWGDRVRRLGLGPAPVPPGRLTAARLAGALGELVSGRYRDTARSFAPSLGRDPGVEGALAIICGGEREPAGKAAPASRH